MHKLYEKVDDRDKPVNINDSYESDLNINISDENYQNDNNNELKVENYKTPTHTIMTDLIISDNYGNKKTEKDYTFSSKITSKSSSNKLLMKKLNKDIEDDNLKLEANLNNNNIVEEDNLDFRVRNINENDIEIINDE